MIENAADWAEIYQLKSAYGVHYDSPDFEALIDLFTDDAVFDAGPYGTWRGKDELRAGFLENIGAPDNNFPTLHSFLNPVISIDGDEATGTWYLLDFALTGGPELPALRATGVYDERYRREDGRWRIAFTKLTLLWNSDVGRMRPGEAVKLEFHANAD